MTSPEPLTVTFPTLGLLIGSWVEAHCVIPDGFRAGDPFILPDEQLNFYANHYRVKPTAVWRPEQPMLATAFHYRRSQLVRPQKWGKNPLIASMICVEGVGPALFGGWSTGREVWDCAEHGCRCGWGYEYEDGEPLGMQWPTPLIQITAVSEDQTDNTWDVLRPMIDNGPLHDLIPKTGEEFIRLPGTGRIDVVTSNARSRLGQRVTFPAQDETGLWTPTTGMVKVADTQRRGAAGMGGRSVETTNGWDPSENSVAQKTAESKRKDIYRDHPLPPAKLKYEVKRDRIKIHRFNYRGAPWVDLDGIEAEAAELLERDPRQAERFFGNRIVAGAGTAFDTDRWKQLADSTIVVPDRALVVAGVDGARFDDALAMIGTDVVQGHQFPIDIIQRPETAPDDYEHDAERADGAMIDFFARFDVWRVYVDPQYIDHLFDRWTGRWGDKIRPWWTNRPKPMAYALRAYQQAMTAGDLSHDGDSLFAEHIGNAQKRKVLVYDDDRRPMWVIEKDAAGSPRKIDGAMGGCLAWEARGDAIADGALAPKKSRAFGSR